MRIESICPSSTNSLKSSRIAAFFHAANEAIAHQPDWTELDDLAGSGPVRGVDSQYRGDAFETVASASWTTSSVWLGIAAELKIEGVAAGVSVGKDDFIIITE